MRIKQLIAAVMLGGITGIMFCVFAAAPVAALSVSDYFTYGYSFTFSKTNITGGEAFTVIVTGQATCVQNLPMPVSAADIVSKVVAKNQQTGAEMVLNPSYSIRYDNSFPNHTGQTASVTIQVPLSFPADSVSGVYNVIGVLTDAHVVSLGISFPAKEYLPPTQAMGTVTYTAPSTGGGGGGVFVPPPTSTTTTSTTTTTTLTTTTTTTPTVVSTSTTTTVTSPAAPVKPTTTSSTIVATTTTTTTQVPAQSAASFTLSDLKLAAVRVASGKTLKITALLTNTGELAGKYEVVMQIDGQYANSQIIELAGKSSQTVTFTHLVDVEGQHTACIGGLSKSFTVEPVRTTDISRWAVAGLAGLALGLGIGGGVILALRVKKYR
jgi:hypothetical protein